MYKDVVDPCRCHSICCIVGYEEKMAMKKKRLQLHERELDDKVMAID
jgi:hypothetical protein